MLLLISSINYIHAQQDVQKSRVIILTDIENEPDDLQSLARLVYSNVIDIKGIIATTSVHMKNDVTPRIYKESDTGL